MAYVEGVELALLCQKSLARPMLCVGRNVTPKSSVSAALGNSLVFFVDADTEFTDTVSSEIFGDTYVVFSVSAEFAYTEVGALPFDTVAAFGIADFDVRAVVRTVRLYHRPTEIVHSVKNAVLVFVLKNVVIIAPVALPRFVKQEHTLFFDGFV